MKSTNAMDSAIYGYSRNAGEFESAMIMHGTGVEGLDNQNDAVQNVVVGKILSVRKHEIPTTW